MNTRAVDDLILNILKKRAETGGAHLFSNGGWIWLQVLPEGS